MIKAILQRMQTELPMPGHSSAGQRLIYFLAPVVYIATDLYGYCGAAETDCWIHAESSRTLVAAGIVLFGYFWPAFRPQIKVSLGTDAKNAALRAEIARMRALLPENISEEIPDVESVPAGSVPAGTSQAEAGGQAGS